MRRGFRIGAEQAEAPVGPDGARRPDFLAIDGVSLALGIEDGLGTHSGHVGTGIGLRPALRPDFFAIGHLRQDAFFLFFRTVLHQRGAEQEDAVLIDAQGSTGAPVFLFENQPFDEVATAPAQLDRPGHHAPVAGIERGFPLAMGLETLGGIETRQGFRRDMGRQPGADLSAEGVVPFGVFQFHSVHLHAYGIRKSGPQNFASRFSTKARRVSADSGCR